jgi:hypothetical protein
MRKYLLCILVCAMLLLLGACTQGELISTEVGDYTYKQEFMSSITTSSGEAVTAGQGNALLVISLTPSKETKVDLDAADKYFFNGTKIKLEGKAYDLKCVVYERDNGNDASVICMLVFEVPDNGYLDKSQQPSVEMVLPSAAK